MFVGGLLVGFWAGALVDRLNRKGILIVSDVVRALLVMLIPSLIDRNIWLAFADLALISMATAFFRPAMFAVIPQIVNRPSLLAANSFFSAMDTGTEIVGPLFAGLLAISYGYRFLLYLDAASYAVSALFILGMSIPLVQSEGPQGLVKRTIWNDVSEGLRFIQRDQLQWALFSLILPAVLLTGGLNALQTPLAKGVVGVTDSEFGTFNSIRGVGFVTASLLLGWYGSNARKSFIILGGYFTMFGSAAVMGLSGSVRDLLLTSFAMGFANTLNYVGVLTVLMERTPQQFIGRVMSSRQVAISGVRVLSPLIFGVLAEVAGVRQAILFMALIATGGTLAVVSRHPILRDIDTGPQKVKSTKSTERIFGILAKVIGPVDPSLDAEQQRKLNVISIGIFALSFLWISYRDNIGREILWLISLALTFASIGYFLRRKRWLP